MEKITGKRTNIKISESVSSVDDDNKPMVEY